MRELDQEITAKWENGELGRSEDHAAVAPAQYERELDHALAMKLVSIRLPIPLIETLKTIAEHHGIAYQPMVRDLLTRFARSEIHQIVSELDSMMQSAQCADESSPPVEAFIERTRHAAA